MALLCAHFIRTFTGFSLRTTFRTKFIIFLFFFQIFGVEFFRFSLRFCFFVNYDVAFFFVF
jgi:hypothetical protein